MFRETKKPNCHQGSLLGNYFVNKPLGVLLGGIYLPPFLTAKCSSVAGDLAAAILLRSGIDLVLDLQITAAVGPLAFFRLLSGPWKYWGVRQMVCLRCDMQKCSPNSAAQMPLLQCVNLSGSYRKNTTESHFEYLLFNYLCWEMKLREERDEEGTKNGS